MKMTNFDIYNYLNLTNQRLAKIYRLSGSSPLPKNFTLTKEIIKEKLTLSQMVEENIFPHFINEEKKKIKKHFKISLKNCQKIVKKCDFDEKFSKKFAEKLHLYFNMRIVLTEMILKDFRSFTFDEAASYQELYNLDPVLGQLLDNLFEENFNIDEVLSDLEKKYKVSYSQKQKLLETNNNRKLEKDALDAENNLINAKNLKINRKIIEKNAKNAQKIKKDREIKKFREEIKKTKTENVKEKR